MWSALVVLVPWDELIGWFRWAELWVHHEQHVGEASSKVDSINVVMP